MVLLWFVGYVEVDVDINVDDKDAIIGNLACHVQGTQLNSCAIFCYPLFLPEQSAVNVGYANAGTLAMVKVMVIR